MRDSHTAGDKEVSLHEAAQSSEKTTGRESLNFVLLLIIFTKKKIGRQRREREEREREREREEREMGERERRARETKSSSDIYFASDQFS